MWWWGEVGCVVGVCVVVGCVEVEECSGGGKAGAAEFRTEAESTYKETWSQL